MKKYFVPLNIIFAVEVIIVILASLGIIPREAVLALTGLMIFYMIFSPVEDSLYLVVASIPLFVALPISGNFDSMANWRILITVLFLCLFFKRGILSVLLKDEKGRWQLKEKYGCYLAEYLILPFLGIAALSIFVADYKILGVKKLLFLINIFLLFLIIRNLAGRKEVFLNILKAAATGASVVVLGGAVQFIAILFLPLYNFWQFWANSVIGVFYGQGLAKLLSISNTWFAYYVNRPPTLRIFSLFPDSHSSAMFLILATPVFLALAVFFEKERGKKIFFWVMVGLSLFFVIMSGSRGAWLSFIPVFIVALYIFIKKTDRQLNRKIIVTAAIFGILFFASSFYPFVFYKVQSWLGYGSSYDVSFFERAKSISDLDEISNKSRLQIWRASISSLAQHPMLGVGLGNYITVLNEDVSAVKKGASAHNLYLDFAAEIGILGVLILLAIFVEILRTCWLVFGQAEEPYFKIFGLAFGLYFLWALVYSLFDVVLLNDKVFLFFMVATGALYSIRALTEDKRKKAAIIQ
ncbi:MAG: O-antigen ligase family protein [bacterium]